MKINEIFVNEMEKIEEVINNLPMEGCIVNFDKYLGLPNLKSEVEKEYIKMLNKNLEDFIIDVYTEKNKNKNNEELLKELKQLMLDGVYAVLDRVCDEGVTDMLYGYSDIDVYPKIKEYMITTFNKLKEEYNKTSKQKEIERLKKEIKIYDNTLKTNIDKLAELNQRLNDVQ